MLIDRTLYIWILQGITDPTYVHIMGVHEDYYEEISDFYDDGYKDAIKYIKDVKANRELNELCDKKIIKKEYINGKLDENAPGLPEMKLTNEDGEEFKLYLEEY